MPPTTDGSSVRVVVAVHSREVKASLFLALNGLDAVVIVGVASSTAELVSYCRALAPNVALIEGGLSRKPLTEVFEKLREVAPECRAMVIEGLHDHDVVGASPDVDVFRDVDQLMTVFPEAGSDQV